MIFSWGLGGRREGRREPGRDCTLYSRTFEFVDGAYNFCDLRQVEWDTTCLSYKNYIFEYNLLILPSVEVVFLVIYLLFVIYPISVDLGGRTPISVSLPAIDCRLHYALLTKPESRCRILAKYFFFLLFYEHTMPMSRILTKQGWSIKQCIKIGQKRTFSPGTLFLTRKIPSGYDWPILPARVANKNKGIVSYCPLADSAIQ